MERYSGKHQVRVPSKNQEKAEFPRGEIKKSSSFSWSAFLVPGTFTACLIFPHNWTKRNYFLYFLNGKTELREVQQIVAYCSGSVHWLGSKLFGFESWFCHSLAGWFWASNLISLFLSFLFSKNESNDSAYFIEWLWQMNYKALTSAPTTCGMLNECYCCSIA